MIFLRRHDKLHEVRERSCFQLILGYPVRRPAAHAIYFAVFAIEMCEERGPALKGTPCMMTRMYARPIRNNIVIMGLTFKC